MPVTDLDRFLAALHSHTLREESRLDGIHRAIDASAERYDDKLGVIAERLAGVEAVQLEQKSILAEHIRRSIAAEAGVERLDRIQQEQSVALERHLVAADAIEASLVAINSKLSPVATAHSTALGIVKLIAIAGTLVALILGILKLVQP
jgi:hypothetical protein